MCESVSSNTQYTQKGPQSKAKARNGTEKGCFNHVRKSCRAGGQEKQARAHRSWYQPPECQKDQKPPTKENKTSGDVEDDECAHNTRNPCHAPGLYGKMAAVGEARVLSATSTTEMLAHMLS